MYAFFSFCVARNNRAGRVPRCNGSMAFFVCMLLAFSVFWPSVPQAAPSINRAQAELFASANKAYQAGDSTGVIRLLQREMERESPHPYACTVYGLGLMQLGRAAQAAEAFNKGLRQTPNDTALQQNYGLALMQSKQYGKAASVFSSLAATLQGKNKAEILYLAGQSHYFARAYGDALRIMAPLADSPDAPKDWVNLAAVSALQGNNWRQAERLFSLGIRRFPIEHEFWKGLAHSRYQQGNKAGTIAALEVASRLRSPRSAQEKKELGALYLQAYAPLLSFSAIKKLSDTHEVHHSRLHCLERAGRYGQVIAYINAMLAKDHSASLYLRKGQALYRAKQPREAFEAFAHGARLSGKDAEQCAILAGMLAWEQGQRDTAAQIFATLGKDSRFHAEAQQALAALQAIQQLHDELEALPSGTITTSSR